MGTKSNRISIEQTIFEFFTYHVPCRLYGNTHTVYTRVYFCIPNPSIFTVYSCAAQSARGASKHKQILARSRTTNVFVPQLSSEV